MLMPSTDPGSGGTALLAMCRGDACMHWWAGRGGCWDL